MKKKYYVYTYDFDIGKFTPQSGVRCGPYTLFGLRKALKKLKNMGYECGRQDPSVLIEEGLPDKGSALARRRAGAVAG